MTVLEKIKRCVSLVWDFQEFYGDEDIEDFCSNELDKYSQYNEILDYFKRIADLEKENAELKKELVEKGQHLDLTEKEWGKDLVQMYHFKTLYTKQTDQLTKAKEIIKYLLSFIQKENYKTRWDINITEAEQFLKEVEK